MKGNRVYDLKETNKEQRDIINNLEETIKNLKQQDLETRISLYYKFKEISDIGHSNNINKNIKMTDIADTVANELFEDIKLDINMSEGKIIELVNEYESKH